MELEDKPFWRDMPVLPESLEWIHRAFWELSGSRREALGRIPFESADRYAERFAVADFDEFWTLIRQMDDVFTKFQNERLKRK